MRLHKTARRLWHDLMKRPLTLVMVNQRQSPRCHEKCSIKVHTVCHVSTTWFCVYMVQTGAGLIQTPGSAPLRPTKHPNETRSLFETHVELSLTPPHSTVEPQRISASLKHFFMFYCRWEIDFDSHSLFILWQFPPWILFIFSSLPAFLLFWVSENMLFFLFLPSLLSWTFIK